MCTTTTILSATAHSSEFLEFANALQSRIIGQEEGVQALVDLNQVLCVGLNSPERPLGSLLFSWTDGDRQNPTGGSRGGDLVRRSLGNDQSRLR